MKSMFQINDQALWTIYRALTVVLGILRRMMTSWSETGVTKPFCSLVKVSASRARVLCPTCHAENNEGFRFCQMCGEIISEEGALTTKDASMDIDEEGIHKRYEQFQAAWAEKASMKSRSATYVLFTKFLESRSKGTTSCIEDTQPKYVVKFPCWLDSCGARR